MYIDSTSIASATMSVVQHLTGIWRTQGSSPDWILAFS